MPKANTIANPAEQCRGRQRIGDDLGHATIEILIGRAKIPARDAGEITKILLGQGFVKMVFGFEIGEDFGRQLSLAIEGAAGR